MTSITIFHDSSNGNTQTSQGQLTLTGYPLLDDFFLRALSRAKIRELEMSMEADIPASLPIAERDMVRVLDEILEAITRMTELASDNDMWAKIIIEEAGSNLRINCLTTPAINHDSKLTMDFAGIVSALGGSANVDLTDDDTRALWADFPLAENTKFPTPNLFLLSNHPNTDRVRIFSRIPPHSRETPYIRTNPPAFERIPGDSLESLSRRCGYL